MEFRKIDLFSAESQFLGNERNFSSERFSQKKSLIKKSRETRNCS